MQHTLNLLTKTCKEICSQKSLKEVTSTKLSNYKKNCQLPVPLLDSTFPATSGSLNPLGIKKNDPVISLWVCLLSLHISPFGSK